MNILIIGEFSAFARHLKNGLNQLGHRVTIVQSGDGSLKLAEKNDIVCRHEILHFRGKPIKGSNRLLAFFSNIRNSFQLSHRCTKPELIIVINYLFLRTNITRSGISLNYIKRRLKRGTKLIMSECGSSPAGAFYMPEYYYELIKSNIPLDDIRYSFLLKNASVIIPTAYVYYAGLIAYSKHYAFDCSKIHKMIPLPITIEDKCEIKSCVDRKIVVFHGVSRKIAKGTPIIQDAMNRIQADYPEKVECVCEGGLPYEEYIKLFENVDVLIDQTYGNGWGMNAIIGAMKGKCVLTPCGPENMDGTGLVDIPFVQIGPSSDQIYNTLRTLINNPDQIDIIKKASRDFAVNHCNSELIAKRYLDSVGLL